MPMHFLIIFIIYILTNSAFAAPLPCSQRYEHQVTYPISRPTIGGDPKLSILPWGTEGPNWGWEHISVISSTHGPALEFFYPQGSINPANKTAPRGGASFYITGGFKSHTNAACLQYKIYFPPGFAFAKGGKLPGLYGGRNEKGESASGCRPGVERDGFSTRYMWRENGIGSLYAYIPGKSETCGTYIGKGAWTFLPGQWTTLEQEVVLNDPGVANGLVRAWADGRLVVDQPGMVLRSSPGISIDGIFFVSFFGGKGPEWASPKDQKADFADINVFFP